MGQPDRDGNGDMGAIGITNNVSYGEKPALTTYSALRDAAFTNNVFYAVGRVLLDIYDGDGLT